MSQNVWLTDLPISLPTHLPQDNHHLGSSILLRRSIANLVICGSVGPEGLSLATYIRFGRLISGTEISICYPSTTSLDLALGPD